MSDTILGGKEKLKRKNLIMFVSIPFSPFQFSGTNHTQKAYCIKGKTQKRPLENLVLEGGWILNSLKGEECLVHVYNSSTITNHFVPGT